MIYVLICCFCFGFTTALLFASFMNEVERDKLIKVVLLTLLNLFLTITQYYWFMEKVQYIAEVVK